MQPSYVPVRKTLECSGVNVWAPKTASHGELRDAPTACIGDDACLRGLPPSQGSRGDEWNSGSSMPHLSSPSDVALPTHPQTNASIVSACAQPAEATRASPPSMRPVVSRSSSSRNQQQPRISSFVMGPSAVLTPRAVEDLPKADAARSDEPNARTPSSLGWQKAHGQRPATAAPSRSHAERGPNVEPDRVTHGSGSAVTKHVHLGLQKNTDTRLHISGTTPLSSRPPNAQEHDSPLRSSRRVVEVSCDSHSPDGSPRGSGARSYGSPRHLRGQSPRSKRTGWRDVSQRSGSPTKKFDERPAWVKCLLHRRLPDQPNLVVDATPLSPKLADHDPSSSTLLPQDWQSEMQQKMEDEATRVRHAVQQRGNTDNKYRKPRRSHSAEASPSFTETSVIEYRPRHITKPTPLWRSALLLHASSPSAVYPSIRPQSACIDKKCRNPTTVPISEPTSPMSVMSPISAMSATSPMSVSKGKRSLCDDQVNVALLKDDKTVRKNAHWGDSASGFFFAPSSTPSQADNQQRRQPPSANVVNLRPHTAEATTTPSRQKRKKPMGNPQQLTAGITRVRPASLALSSDAFVINGKPTLVHHHKQSYASHNADVSRAEGARSPLLGAERDRPISKEKITAGRGCAAVNTLIRPLPATILRDRRCKEKVPARALSSIIVERCSLSKWGDARVVMPKDALGVNTSLAAKAKY